MKKMILLFLTICCVACSNEDEGGVAQVACTEEFIFGLSVEVRDAITDSLLTTGIVVAAQDGDYNETLELASDEFVGAEERVGVYDLNVSGPGYQTQEIDSVAVVLTADECHVITQEVSVALVPN